MHKLTHTSKAVLAQQIKEALDYSGLNKRLNSMQKKEEELRKQQEEMKRTNKLK